MRKNRRNDMLIVVRSLRERTRRHTECAGYLLSHFATPSPSRLSAMPDNLLPSSANEARWAETWQELGQGAPTLAGLARVCSLSMATGGDKSLALSPEAKAILSAARKRAVIEVKG